LEIHHMKKARSKVGGPLRALRQHPSRQVAPASGRRFPLCVIFDLQAQQTMGEW